MIISLLIFGLAMAQDQIKVAYEVQPYYNPADNKFSGFDMSFKSSNFELISDSKESQFDYIEKISNEQPKESGISMSIEVRSDGTLYKNLDESLILEETDFEGKHYLVKDTFSEIDWKISKETKNIAGFDCYKATATLDDNYKAEVTAWYSPKLTFKNGPDEFWGLPGLILEVETNIKHESGATDGAIYTAQKVETLTKTKKISRPTKGKEISREEFSKMQKAHFEKMMEMYSEGVDKD